MMNGKILEKDIESLRRQGIPEDLIETYRRISDGSNGNPTQKEIEVFKKTTDLLMLLLERKAVRAGRFAVPAALLLFALMTAVSTIMAVAMLP